MPSKTSSTRVTSYMKNLGKSFGYALGDVFKEYNPVVYNMGKEIKESSQDLYQNIKSFTMDKSTASSEKFGDVKGLVDSAWQNALSDIKTGKWYNKERADAMDGDFAKALGFDFDFDFDFDSEDWGDDLDSSDKAVMSAESESTRQVVGAMDVVGSSVANSVNRATAESATYIVASSNRASKALYDLNVKGFGNVTNAIIAVNNTLGSIGKLGEPLSAHMQNSAVFFTNTTKKLDDIYQVLGKIAENTTRVPVAKNKTPNKKIGLEDLFTDDGLDFYTMKEMVKGSFKDYKDLGDMALNAVNTLKGSKNVSVMQFATTMMTKALIPNMFKKSMEEFNKSLSMSMKAGFADVRNRLHGRGGSNSKVIDGGIIDMILGMFIPDRGTKKTVAHGNYEKGAVAWDGKSRKALIEVIPDTLLAIYSSLSGAPMMTYDYDKGTYVTKQSVLDQWLKDKKKYEIEAGGDFRTQSLSEAKNGTFVGASNADVFHYVNLYFNKAFESGNNDFYDWKLVRQNFVTLVGGLEKGSDRRAADEAMRIITKRLKDPKVRKQFEYNNEVQNERLQNFLNSVDNDSTYHMVDNGFVEGGSRNKSNRNRRHQGSVGKSGVVHNANDSSVRNSEMDSFSGSTQTELDRLNGEEIDNEIQQRTDNIKGEAKTWVQKFKNFFFKGANGKSGLMELYERPFNAASDLLLKISDGIDKVLFGDKDDKDSLANRLKEKFEKIFDPVKEWFKGFWDETKQYLGKAGNWAGNIFFGKDRMAKWKARSGQGETEPMDNGNAAGGRRVTRTGIVAVSEGELIIPSNMNPYYNGRKISRTQQARNERNAARRYFGNFAGGGTAGENNDESLDNSVLGYLLRFLTNSKDTVVNGFKSGMNKAKEKADGNKIISDKMKTITNDLFKELGASKGAMGAGAIIGAGASLFTGGLVGPLFGASLGAAAGLTINSQNVQKALFGATDENGNFQEGLFSKETSDFMKNQLPGIAKGGVIGAAGGLFMGSPLLGAMLGAGFNFARNSESVKNTLFGEFEDDGKTRKGGVISKELQDKIKKAAPAAGVGALAGMAVGPFGVVGNLMFGSALGMAATSESFKAKMFGGKWTDSKGKEHEEEGLINKLSNNLLKNVNGVFHNIYNNIKGWSAKFLTNTTRFAKEQIAKAAGKSKVVKGVKGIGGALGRGVMNLTGGAIDLSGGLFRGVNSAWSKHNAKKGYDVYDPTLGRNLTAKERGASSRSGKWQTYLTALGDMNDTTQVQALIDELEGAKYDSEKATELMSQYGLKKGDIATALQNAKGQLKQVGKTGTVDRQVSATEKIETWVQKIYNVLHGGTDNPIVNATEEGEESYETYHDALGGIHQVKKKKDKNGKTEESPDNSDNETKQSEKEMSKFKQAIFKIPLIGGALEGLSGRLHDFFFGSKDDDDGKKGIFSKLKELFMGDDGLLSTFFSWFGGTKVGKLGAKLLSKAKPLASLITESWGPLLGTALLAAGFSGKLDNIASKIGFGTKTDKYGNTGTGTGNTYNYYDKDGNQINPETATAEQLASATVKVADKNTLSTGLVKNTVRGAITGRGSVAGVTLKALSKSKIGRAAASTNIGKSISRTAESVAKADGNLLVIQMQKNLDDLARALEKVPMLRGLSDSIDNIAVDLAGEAGEEIAKSSTKALTSLAETAGKAVIVLQVAMVIADFTTGYEDAATNLKVKNPTTGERIVCGLLRAIKNYVPIVGSLIPDSVIIDICVKHIFPALGLDISDFNKRRDEAQEELDAYNTANGTDMSWSEYNKSVRQDYTWTERIGNAAKTTWSQTKAKASNIRNGIKEQGLGGYVKSSLSSMATNFMDAYNENGGGISGISSGIGETFGNLLPGVLGEISQKNWQIQSLALQGKFKEMWQISLNDFSKQDNGDVETAVPSIFSKIIGQVPLIMNKLIMTPVAGITMAAKKILEPFSSLIDKVKSGFSSFGDNIKDAVKTNVNYITAEDFSYGDYLSGKDQETDEENPLHGFAKVLTITTRMFQLPKLFLARTGYKVGKGIANTVKKIANTISIFNQQDKYMIDLLSQDAKDFKPSEIFDVSEFDDPENPMGGFMKAAILGKRISAIPMALVAKAGKAIWGGVKSLVDKVKDGALNIFETEKQNLTDFVTNPDKNISALYTIEENEDVGPLGGFSKALIHAERLVATPIILLAKGAYTIYDFIKEPISKFTANQSKVSEAGTSMKALAKEGNLKDVISFKNPVENDGPLSKLNSVFFSINKVFYTIAAAFNAIADPLGNLFGGIGDKIDSATSWIKDKVNAGKNAVNKVDEATGNAYDSSTGWLGQKLDSAWSALFGGSGSFINQTDPRYSGVSVGGKSFATNGCGPAAAVMSAGGNLGAATRLAQYYQTNAGTDAAYFADYARMNGKNASYAFGPSGAAGAIYGGSGTILLGQDPTNRSKANSPFGPNGHYVSVDGTTRNGGLVISDPEQRGRRVYSRNAARRIINSSKLAINMSGSGSGRLFRFGSSFAGGGSVRNDSITQQIWAYLTTKLGMSEAAAAGVMGNMQQESGCNPNVNQVGGPAYGLCQWEGSRKANLMKQSNYQSLNTQLAFLASELPSQYWSKSGVVNDTDGKSYKYDACTYEQFKQLSDVATATIKFEAAFERAGKPGLANRITYASQYYKMFTGKTYQYNGSDVAISSSTSSSSGTSTSSSSSSSSEDSVTSAFKSGGLLSGFTTLISNAFGKVFGGTSSSSSSSSDSTSSSSSSSSTDNSSYDSLSLNANNATDRFIEAAKSQIGYTETPDNITKFGKFTGVDGQPWCSSFVSWAANQAVNGDSDAASKILRGGPTAAVSTLWDRFKSANAMSSTPQKGDIVIYKNNGSSHTGIVESVSGKNITTIEGNTSGPVGKSSSESNGGEVARKTWVLGSGTGKDKALTGFGRPDWDALSGMDYSTYSTSGNLRDRGYSSSMSGSGSGLNVVSYNDYVSRRSGGSSGVLLNSRVGSSVYGNNPSGVYVPKHRRAKFIGERGKTVYRNNRVDYSAYAGGASGLDTNNEAVVKLLQGIYNYIANIDSNTGEGGWIQNSIDGTSNALANTVKGITSATSKTSSANVPDKFGNIAVENLSKQLYEISVG